MSHCSDGAPTLICISRKRNSLKKWAAEGGQHTGSQAPHGAGHQPVKWGHACCSNSHKGCQNLLVLGNLGRPSGARAECSWGKVNDVVLCFLCYGHLIANLILCPCIPSNDKRDCERTDWIRSRRLHWGIDSFWTSSWWKLKDRNFSMVWSKLLSLSMIFIVACMTTQLELSLCISLWL